MKMKKRNSILIGLLVLTVFSFGYIKYYDLNTNDIGLSVLSWVKKLKGDAVNLDDTNNKEVPLMEHLDWTALLQRHVTEAGQVNYKGFIKDSILFDKYLTDLSKHPTGSNWSEREKLAYWINAYNAFTVKLILDNYPLNSIKDIGDGLVMINSPWDIKFFKIGHTDFDLNTIEHEILRKQFDEPRIHFAINCASFSCPKLRNEAYTAQNLEGQLNEQALEFINNPDKNIINNNDIRLSKIFDWFQSDFKKETKLLDYIKRYNPTVNEKNKIEYLEYNWALNEQ